MKTFIISGGRQGTISARGACGNRAYRRRLQSVASRAVVSTGIVNAQPISFAGLVALEPRVLLSGNPTFQSSGPPQIVLEGLSETIINGDSSPSDTDGTALGSIVAQTTATRQFTVRNTGTGMLNISSLTLPDGYVLVESLSQTIAPNASDTFTIKLDTETLGVKSGQITILSDDPFESFFNFSISATVIQTTGPEISVRAAGASISIVNGDNSPDLADLTSFGDVFVGSNAYRNFVIHNLGDKTLKISNFTVPAWLVLTSTAPTSIAPGASAQFTIRVDTSDATQQASPIRFTTNDADEGEFSFAVSARVIRPAAPELLLVGLENSNFGDVPLGLDVNVDRTFTISNVGFAPLHISDLTVTPGFIIDEGLSTSPLERDGLSDTFTVRVDNSVLGPVSGFVSFKTNDPLWGDIIFPIGAVVTPVPVGQVEVYGNGLVIRNNDDSPRFEDHTDLGTLPRGGGNLGGSVRTFTILNNSATVLNLSSLSVTEGFSIFEDMPASLPPKATGTFRIEMDTSVPSARDGFVSFHTDDSNAATYTFRVMGVVTSESVSKVTVLGNGQPIENGDNSPTAADFTSFGTAAQGSDGVLHTFIVRNVGSRSVQLSDLIVPEGFEIVEGMDAALGATNKDTLTLRMLTGTPGVKSGNVTFKTYEIVNGNGISSTFSFAIQGVVIASNAGSDDTVVSISTIESTALESTLAPGIIRINRTGPVSKALNVAISRSGNATYGTGATGDYTLSVDGFIITKSVTIPASASFVDLFVNPLNDGKPDPFESVTVKLGGGSGYFLDADPNQRTATVAIEDDAPVISIVAATPELESPEPAPAFARSFAAFADFSFASEVASEPETDSTASETNTGDVADTAIFRIHRSGNITGAIDVKFSVSGTARLSKDYILMINGVATTAKVATIAAGEEYVDLVIVPINDAIVEKTENIKISVVANKGVYSLDPDKEDRAATITIEDNEPTVSVEAIDAQASEPGSNENPGTFRIHRTGTTGEALTVAFTLSGTAKRRTDYVDIGSSVTLPAGVSFVDVDIRPISDARTEAQELVTLKLKKSRAYTIDPGAPADTITITDAAQIAGVDLLAVAMKQPPKTFKLASINSPLKLSATIVNQGNALSAAGAQVRVLLSRDRVIDVGDIAIGNMSASLPAMGSKPVTHSGLFNIDGRGLSNSSIGSYFVLLAVDSTNLVDEAFENNNTFASFWSNVVITA